MIGFRRSQQQIVCAEGGKDKLRERSIRTRKEELSQHFERIERKARSRSRSCSAKGEELLYNGWLREAIEAQDKAMS